MEQRTSPAVGLTVGDADRDAAEDGAAVGPADGAADNDAAWVSAKVDVGATVDSAIPAGPGPVPPIPGPPPLDAVRGPRCDLTMPCMLFDTFQRLGTGFQRRDRPAPVETKEKLLLTDGRERWLVVEFALLFFSFPL